MKSSKPVFILACAAALLSFGSSNVQAQGKGNFDPAQMVQRMMERYREVLDVKNDDEWKLIEVRITKVTEARRDAGGFGGIGGFGGGGRRPGGDQGGGQQGQDRQRTNPFAGAPMPEQEALQKAIEAKAPADEIKAKLARYRDARKVREEKLEKAQDELRQVLSVKQEAGAVLLGLLK